MFSKVFGLLTPEFKIQFLAKQLGLGHVELQALDETLKRAAAIPGVSMLLGGRELSLTTIVSVISSPEPYKAAGALLPAVQSMIATDEGASALANAVEAFVSTDPNGEVIAGLLSKLSHLPIVGFGDIEHTGVADFLSRAVFPLLRVPASPEQSTLTAPFRCRFCGQDDHIPVTQTNNFVHKCSNCEQVQVVHVIQG